MRYVDGGGHRLRLWAEPDSAAIPYKTFLFIAATATCDGCWHADHATPVATCLDCPDPMEAVA